MNTKKLPIGVSDFKKIVEDNLYFVDKSLWIKDVIDSSDEVQIYTRPRRFGKTLNMSMLKYFLTNLLAEVNSELFRGTKIANHKSFCSEHQNKYPVIFISFKDVKQSSFEDLVATLKTVIASLYKKHRYLLDSKDIYSDEKKNIYNIINQKTNRASLIESIKSLSEYLKRTTGKKVYILIDEYDTPITAGYLNNFYKEAIEIMRDIFGFALKDNEYLKKGVITGITRVSQESLFSGVNHLEVYSMLDSECGQYFGFTEGETKALLKDDNNLNHFEEIKRWYNGYQIGNHTVYNPWSILKCIKKGYKYHTYWLNTSDNALIQELISAGKPKVKDSFINLLQGKSVKKPIMQNLIFPKIKTNENALWSLMHASGYIKITGKMINQNDELELAIPNEEVSYVYKDMIENWFTETVSLDSYKLFINSLAAGKIEEFHAELSNFLQESGSYFDFNKNSPEQVFHSFMLGIVIGLKDSYIIHSNKESGSGRYYLILIPKSSDSAGIILEFKTVKKVKELKVKSQEGLKQIKRKKYYTILQQHKVNSVRMLGLAFCGKKVEISSEKCEI